MSETNGTGIMYPTLELGGKLYVVKFTRGGILYRLSRSGASIGDLGGPKSFSATIDFLHAALHGQYYGTAEELAEIIYAEDKMNAAAEAIAETLKKVFPPTQTTPAAGTADQEAAPVVQ